MELELGKTYRCNDGEHFLKGLLFKVIERTGARAKVKTCQYDREFEVGAYMAAEEVGKP